ncbi:MULTISPECIES: 2-oxo-tetronate isomerase [Giesbergeria]|uniref:2-oxo-tetronate isomerase n=1 Tax=Giesbergeria sinuosa TaxID=80883 RepID=A0ABV9QDU1_9BURK
MSQFAANLSWLYPHLPFLDRFEAAARDGFTAVEYLAPYGWEAGELAARLRTNGLRQVLFNAPAAGLTPPEMAAAWQSGARGTAALPGQEAAFRAGVQEALRYAAVLDCPRIHVMSGMVPVGADVAAMQTTLIDNLRWACMQAAAQGCQLLIEPINARDMPGYFLQRQAQAHAVLDAVDSPHLKVLMDLYHCQVAEGDVASKLRQYLPTGRVAHIQIAGVPERQEPDIGELHYPYLFDVLDALGYAGWIGCEYRPAGDTSSGLGWRPRDSTPRP